VVILTFQEWPSATARAKHRLAIAISRGPLRSAPPAGSNRRPAVSRPGERNQQAVSQVIVEIANGT
jgi:hypothetical protein